MIAGRGASEFIWAMGRELDHAAVHVPLPGYTDYLKAFPGRGFSLAGEQLPAIEQVDAALDTAAAIAQAQGAVRFAEQALALRSAALSQTAG